MSETILIGLILILIYIFLFINRNDVIYVETKSGTKFLVHKDNMTREKGELLSQIVQNMYILRNHLIKNKNNMKEYKEYIEQLETNFTDTRTEVHETDPESDLTSFSINKGEEVSFCLRSKNSKKLHDINLLMYVAIHEMAHFACPEVGHGELYKKIFKKFIEEAIKIGIYNYVNYESNPVEYCGMILSSSIV